MTHGPTIDTRGVTAADGTTKAKLERAALALFVEHGVDAATTRDIAAGAGVADGTLYRHFTGKDALAEEVFFAIHSRLADLVENAAAETSGAPFSATIGAIIKALCVFADDDPAAFTYHLLYTHHYLPRRPKARNPVSAIETLIEAAAARGDVTLHASPALYGAMALGPVLQTALHRIYGRLTGPMQMDAAALTRAVCAIFGLEPAQNLSLNKGHQS